MAAEPDRRPPVAGDIRVSHAFRSEPSEKVKQARGWHDRSTTMQTMIRSRRTIDHAKRVGTLENKPKLTRVILDCCEG